MELELRRRPRSSLAPELTPLIDVVFQLLVFFLLTTTFTVPAVPLELPGARSGQESPQHRRIDVSLTKDGRIFVGGSVVSEAQIKPILVQRLRLSPELQVVIRGDVGSRYGLFMAVLDACREAGAVRVKLETTPLGKP